MIHEEHLNFLYSKYLSKIYANNHKPNRSFSIYYLKVNIDNPLTLKWTCKTYRTFNKVFPQPLVKNGYFSGDCLIPVDKSENIVSLVAVGDIHLK